MPGFGSHLVVVVKIIDGAENNCELTFYRNVRPQTRVQSGTKLLTQRHSCLTQLQEETLRIGQNVADIEEKISQETSLKELKNEESQAQAVTAPQKDRLSFPETTSKMIGWKIQPELLQSKSIERHARGKQDIVKMFKWPREGC